VNSDAREGLADLIELEGFDDGDDQLHDLRSPQELAQVPSETMRVKTRPGLAGTGSSAQASRGWLKD
jgi:hypothetical protein